MSTKIIRPSISEKAFNCPHCDVLAVQYWYAMGAKQKDRNHPVEIPDSFSYIFGAMFPADGAILYNTHITNLNICTGKNLSKDIASLVEKGLHTHIQQSLV